MGRSVPRKILRRGNKHELVTSTASNRASHLLYCSRNTRFVFSRTTFEKSKSMQQHVVGKYSFTAWTPVKAGNRYAISSMCPSRTSPYFFYLTKFTRCVTGHQLYVGLDRPFPRANERDTRALTAFWLHVGCVTIMAWLMLIPLAVVYAVKVCMIRKSCNSTGILMPSILQI